MASIVLCHGAWSSAWAWRRMRPLMREAGHDLFAPSYTGLGERAHLAHDGIDLETHIADVLAVIETEELSDVTLLGHSYGGIVATGVADLARPAVGHVIYLDAFVPRDGQSLFDLVPAEHAAEMQRKARETGDGWRVPPNPAPPDTSPEDQAWIARHRRDMPIGCLSQKLVLTSELDVPRHYIYATRTPPGAPFRRFADRARTEPGWTLHEIDTSHSPAITAPDRLMKVLSPILD